MSKLPDFDADGLLPPGDYVMTLDELAASRLVLGNQHSEHWDETWRLQLLKNLVELVDQLWSVGVTRIFIDGSFAEAKDHPNDIDGYFE